MFQMNCDTTFCILSYLSLRDLLTSSLVNREFNKVSRNVSLWRNLSERDYPGEIDDDYHNNYVSHYKLYHLHCNRWNVDDRVAKNTSRLHLDNRGFQILPLELRLLTNLSHLYLYDNDFKTITIPSSFVNLRVLDLTSNQFEDIPSDIFLLTKLEELLLGCNEIKNIPQELFSLTNLEQLYLHNNRLESVPSEIGLLTKLQELSLDRNKYKSLPSSMSLLTRLYRLCLNTSDCHMIPSYLHHTIQRCNW
jgi:Leucine-rich repeat (LRR) protein